MDLPFAYSGPKLLGYVPGALLRYTYSGSLRLILDPNYLPEALVHNAYSGSVRVKMPGPGHFVYDEVEDFALWGGAISASNGSITSNTATTKIGYTPVENSGMGAAAGIDRVNIAFRMSGNETGQQIYVSIRANTTTFAANNTTIPWGSWVRWNDLNGLTYRVAGGGQGNYVQLRIMWVPGTVTTQYAPIIDRLDFWTNPQANGEAAVNTLSRIDLNPNQFRSNIPSRIGIRFTGEGSVLAQLKVVELAPISYVPSKIQIRTQGFSNVKSKISVRQGLITNIPAKIYFREHGEETVFVPARLTIARETIVTNVLPAKVKVRQASNGFVPSKIFHKAYLVPARIVVKSPYQTSFIPSRIFVRPDQASAVGNLRSNVANGVYQNNPNVVMNWDASTPATSAVTGYYYSLDITATSPANITTWTFTTSRTVSYNLNLPAYGAGKRYFHVAAMNAAGHIGVTSHYGIFYNNRPVPPGATYMRINDFDTINTYKTISSSPLLINTLTWNPSTDSDATDSNLKYHVQIASRSDFGIDPVLNLPSVERSIENIGSANLNLSPLPTSGLWFWRIRTFDGKEYSDWSRVGGFRVNKAPSRPSGMIVEDY